MEFESAAIAQASLTRDGREGVSAFLEKRPAVYGGN
jgi:enoyl-CoA hydratase/carnithine racemase